MCAAKVMLNSLTADAVLHNHIGDRAPYLDSQ